ncbi:DeoR/GlpR family DNA-binding transcription regulator [Inquilinus sp.]|uniref:DeoR/GlpR family DNA-binding transcription regulator n=1 Tax=Inquilinus sp. TaxID=1932117 RepID=UPI0031E2C336
MTDILLPEERRKRLLDLLALDGKILATAASATLGVSEDTIRRDLNDLARAGVVRRVHGGALPLPLTPATGTFATRATERTEAKAALGRMAAELIRPGEVVLLDGGTTMLAVAEALPPDLRATIVTPNLPAALALTRHPSAEVVLLGGRLDKADQATVGTSVLAALDGLRADFCLLGVCSLDVEAGLGGMDHEEALVKRRMAACAGRVAAVVTADKLGTAAPFPILPVGRLDALITERSADPGLLAACRQTGLTLILA